MTESTQTQEIQPEYKIRFLATLYVETGRAFDPNLFGKPQSPSLNTPELKMAGETMRKDMTRLLREQLATYFLTHYKSNFPNGTKVDGVEHEGKAYGKRFQDEARAKGRNPIIVPWKDVPRFLDFEKFLKK